jgi:hypothetical protein
MDIVAHVGATRPRPAVLTAHDLSTTGWTLDPLRPEATTLVVGGRHISVDAIGRITVQDAAVRAETLTWLGWICVIVPMADGRASRSIHRQLSPGSPTTAAFAAPRRGSPIARRRALQKCR